MKRGQNELVFAKGKGISKSHNTKTYLQVMGCCIRSLVGDSGVHEGKAATARR